MCKRSQLPNGSKTKWRRNTRLKTVIESRIGELPMHGNLERVGEEQAVTEAHLPIGAQLLAS